MARCRSVGLWEIALQGIGCVFFFKQKTAYEMLRSLVGSEMCIRDSVYSPHSERFDLSLRLPPGEEPGESLLAWQGLPGNCLLYTSDAADELLCVDLGGRRIIKKKNN